MLSFDDEGGVEQKWEVQGEMNERRSYLASAAGKAGKRIYTVGGDLNVDGSTAECLGTTHR